MDERTFRSLIEKEMAEYLSETGWIIYSGIDAIKQSSFYVMGLNPKRDNANRPIKDCPTFSSWSAYQHQCWKGCGAPDIRTVTETSCLHRKDNHQNRVLELFSMLNQRPEQVFSANAIFVESDDKYELFNRPDFNQLWAACWRVHRTLLSIIQPQWIICLGKDPSPKSSSFGLLKRELERNGAVRLHEIGNGRWMEGKIDGIQKPLKVIGLHHPSWAPVDGELEEFIKSNLALASPHDS